MEVVLRQIGRGAAQADTVIRGQHEQLSGAMEREQKTKRELVSLGGEAERSVDGIYCAFSCAVPCCRAR